MVKINHSIKKSQLFVRNITLHYISLTSVAIHPELWYIHIRSEMTLARQLPRPHVVEAPGSPPKRIFVHYSSYLQICINGVSISVNKGTFACIMGTSGSGKTTLINILSTIDEATSGKLLIFDQNIVGLSDKEKANIRKRYMGFIFQDYNLIDSLKVIDNILFSLKLNKKNIINEAEIKQIISSLGIEELLDKYPFECSGGQQQRIAIARALVCKPKILFADEPTGNVDSIRAKQLMEYFTEINRKYGITIVMVTHDCLVASYASEMYYVEDGKIINHIFKGNDSFEKFYNRIARISMQIKL